MFGMVVFSPAMDTGLQDKITQNLKVRQLQIDSGLLRAESPIGSENGIFQCGNEIGSARVHATHRNSRRKVFQVQGRTGMSIVTVCSTLHIVS